MPRRPRHPGTQGGKTVEQLRKEIMDRDGITITQALKTANRLREEQGKKPVALRGRPRRELTPAQVAEKVAYEQRLASEASQWAEQADGTTIGGARLALAGGVEATEEQQAETALAYRNHLRSLRGLPPLDAQGQPILPPADPNAPAPEPKLRPEDIPGADVEEMTRVKYVPKVVAPPAPPPVWQDKPYAVDEYGDRTYEETEEDDGDAWGEPS